MLFSRNSTRFTEPVAVARKVTSPVTDVGFASGWMPTTGPAAVPAGAAEKSSNVTNPATAAARPTPALPAAVMAPSCRSKAKSGLSVHDPSAASHCRVSAR